ncbi:YdcA family protein [Winslowiella toletana]|uniref:YdcA family protein n=1 Tax=Winslowiella toletana TaxID=92490 RepID=UPI0028BE9DDA|nr:hypothetical protein [Winslowiella toletana]WNN43176.1 hypothetical protein RIN69_15905 [Winslowiella toletana]
MKKIIPLLMLSLLVATQTDAARGRQPCSGSKGGISHCTTGGAFVCNDGSLSQSKRVCSGYGSGSSQQITSSATVKKVQQKKAVTAPKKKVVSPPVVENEESVQLQPRKPTCAPLYMASKPGFTHLPICSGNQY